MNYKHGWRKTQTSEEEHPLVTRRCAGYRSELVLLKKTGKKVWIQERCEMKFKTRDDTKIFCSLKCRVNRHRMLHRE